MQETEVIKRLNFETDLLKAYLEKSYRKLENIQKLVDEIAR